MIRHGACDSKASIFYSTEEVQDSMNSALEIEDFEPLRRAELEFDRGEIEK